LFNLHNFGQIFQEEIPLKLKTLAVIALLVLGCSAAFAQTTVTFGFQDYTGSILYCNYETFTYGGADNFYAQGIDNLSNCSAANPAATVEGLKISIYQAANTPVPGWGYAMADNIVDAIYGVYTGEQWLYLTHTKANNPRFPKWGWAGYIGYGGYEFFGNYGYLSSTIPAKGNGATSWKSTVQGLKGSKLVTRMVK
jgi:hypothetical protein